MAVFLAVILAKICMKTIEEKLSTEDDMSLRETKNFKQKFLICHKKWFGLRRPAIVKNAISLVFFATSKQFLSHHIGNFLTPGS